MRRPIVRASLLLIAVAFPNCLTIPPWSGAVRFTGCFTGPITDPAGQGNLKIVIEIKDGSALQGCAAGRNPEFQATFAGTVLEDDPKQARLTAMSPGASPFTLLVERRPPDNANAVTLSVRNEAGMPFVAAPDLPRCGAPTTCDELGIALPFMPGGAQ